VIFRFQAANSSPILYSGSRLWSDCVNKRRVIIGGVLAVAIITTAIIVWVKSRPNQTPGGPSAGGVTVVTAAGQDPVSLDPAKLADTESSPFVSAVFAPLALVNPAGELVYVLAESVEMSADAMQATVVLRANAKFSDRSPVTAADVRWSLERVFRMHPQRYVLERVAGIKDATSATVHAAGFQIVNDRTLVVRFDRPDPEWPRLIATTFAGIVKSGSDEGPKLPLDRGLIGAGPFKLKDVEPGHKYLFERNPGFPLDHGLASLEIRILANEQEMARQAESGGLNLLRVRGNLVREIAVRQGASLQLRPGFRKKRLERLAGQDLLFLRINWQDAAFKDVPPERRRAWADALGASIDRAALAEKLYLSTAVPASTVVPSSGAAISPPAGGSGGPITTGTKIELVTGAVGELRQVSDLVASNLRSGALTMQVDVRLLPIGDLIQRLFAPNYQVALLWLESNLSPPGLSWGTFFTPGGISALAEPLPQTPAMLDAARSTADPAKRQLLLAGLLDDINRTQTALVPLVRREAVYLVGDELSGPGADFNGIQQFSLLGAKR
jgi:ABC-type transport system substrate-binding protein